MNRIQKIAWCFVIMFLVSLVVSLVAVAVFYTKVGMPKALYGIAFMSLFGLAGFAPIIFRKDKQKIVVDERDAAINRLAALAGFTAAYLVMGLACMIPFFVIGPRAQITVQWLPVIFMAAGISHFFVYSVAILVGYGRDGKEGHNV